MGRTQLWDSSINLRCNESDIEIWKDAAKKMNLDLSSFIRDTLNMCANTPKMLDIGKLVIPDDVPDAAFFDLGSRTHEVKVERRIDYKVKDAKGTVLRKGTTFRSIPERQKKLRLSRLENKVFEYLKSNALYQVATSFEDIKSDLRMNGRKLSAILLNLKRKHLITLKRNLYSPNEYTIFA